MAPRQPTDRGGDSDPDRKESGQGIGPRQRALRTPGTTGCDKTGSAQRRGAGSTAADCTRHLLALEQTAGQAEAVPARGEASGSVQLSRGCFRGWQSLRLHSLACNTVGGGTLRGIVEAENSANLSDERQFTVSRCGGWQLPQR